MVRDQLYCLLLDLLKTTTPYGTENFIHQYLPLNGSFDDCGNYWVMVGNHEDSLFCCHMDTVGSTQEQTDIMYDDGKLYTTNPKAPCLGGDDRCGMLCLIAMIDARVPGTYLFHVGEEKGCVGSEYINKTYDMSCYKRAISFDRRGKNSLITVMMGNAQVCSDEFADALCKQLDFVKDPTGLYTDSWSYSSEIPEITNLSVGYEHEHSNKEIIHVDWLLDVFIPKLIAVDWNLPTVRNPKEDNYYNPYSFSENDENCCNFCGEASQDLDTYYNEGTDWKLCKECSISIQLSENDIIKHCDQCCDEFFGKGNLCEKCFQMEIMDNEFLLKFDKTLNNSRQQCLNCGETFMGKIELCSCCMNYGNNEHLEWEEFFSQF